MQSGSFLINPLATIFSLGFIVAGFVLILIEERSGKILHLQLVSGMSKSVYWVSTFLWDLTVYFLFAFLVIGFYKMFRDSCFTDPAVLPTIVLLLISYGAAVTPWVYCISFLFHSPTTAYIVIFSLNFFSGFSMLIVDAILVYVTAVKVTSGESLTNPNLLAVPFPSYALVRSLMYTTLDRPLKKLVASYNNSDVPHPLTELWPFVLSLWVQALVYTFIVVLVQALPDLCKMKHRSAIFSLSHLHTYMYVYTCIYFMYCIILYCAVLYCTVLYYTILLLYSTLLYYAVLCYSTELNCTVLYGTLLYYTVLYSTILCCTLLLY